METRFFGRFQNALVGLAERKKVEVTKSTDGMINTFITCRIEGMETILKHLISFTRFIESLGALVLCLKVMPSVSRIKKADFSSKLGRLFYFVKVISVFLFFTFIDLTECHFFFPGKC